MKSMPYRTLSSFLRERFGCRVRKITVDAGLTCPNRDGTVGIGGCIYCNERGSGTGASRSLSVREQIESAKEFMRRRYGVEKYIVYFQSFSNTYAPVSRLERLYGEALDAEDIVGLAIGTRPDCVPEETLDLISDVGRRTCISLEYGLQSAHDATLAIINRGHDFEVFRDAVERTRRRNIDVTAHVILGLPGETKEDMIETARAIGSMGILGVKIHLLYVVRGTRLHDMFAAGKYTCLTRDAYADIVADFLAVLPPDMVIHRLTGDPHRDELVAPEWALDKEANLAAIRRIMEERNIVQGSRAV